MPFASKVRRFFTGQAGGIGEIIELSDNQFEPEDIKFEMFVHGKRRTVGMHDLRDVAAVVDVTNEVVTHKDGYPKFESIGSVAVELLGELETELYGSGGV